MGLAGLSKADGSLRFCVDYRTTINKFLVRETWPMPDIESHIDIVGGANFITVCDVQSAYWQIPICSTKGPSQNGICNIKRQIRFQSPSLWHRECILDIPTCHVAGLTLKPARIHFGPKEVQYLGHVLSADGIRMSEDRIKAIIDLKTPTTIKELRSVLGTVNFVPKFIPNLATIIEPLVALTRNSVVNLKTLRNHWGPEQDAAFKKVKELLTSAPLSPIPQVVYNPCRSK